MRLSFSLLPDQMMRSSEQDLRRQISPLLSTQRAGDDDGLEREVEYPGGYVSLAPFAFDHELFALLDSEGHGRKSIDENKAKVYLRKSYALTGTLDARTKVSPYTFREARAARAEAQRPSRHSQ